MRRIEGPDRPKGRRRVGSFLRECVRDRDKYAMLLPFFVLYGLFTLAPILCSILLSLTDFNMLSTRISSGWTIIASCCWRTAFSPRW